MAIVVDSSNVKYSAEYIETKYEYQFTKVDKKDTKLIVSSC